MTSTQATHHGRKTTGALARLTVHLVGRHETTVRTAGAEEVLLTIPGAVILIKRPEIAHVWWEGWCKAAALADRVYGSGLPSRPHEPTATVRSWIELTGPARPAIIDAHAPQASATGTGEITVRVANLVVSCGDRDAFGHQLAAWALAYTHAAAIWNLSSVQHVANQIAHARGVRARRRPVPEGRR